MRVGAREVAYLRAADGWTTRLIEDLLRALDAAASYVENVFEQKYYDALQSEIEEAVEDALAAEAAKAAPQAAAEKANGGA